VSRALIIYAGHHGTIWRKREQDAPYSAWFPYVWSASERLLRAWGIASSSSHEGDLLSDGTKIPREESGYSLSDTLALTVIRGAGEVKGKDASGVRRNQTDGKRKTSNGDLDRRPRRVCAVKGKRRYARRQGGLGTAE
jgi:hypothetical protein